MDGYFRWVGLTIRGAPLLNDFGFTHNVICSVYWTLRVEYVFYLCLPYLSVALLRTVRLRWLFLSASLLFYVYHFRGWRCGIHDAMPFSGGVIAAFLARSEFVCKLLSGAVASAFGLAIIAVTVLYFPPEARSLCVIPLSLLFVLISCGNDFFGTISSRWALILGDVSYGVYLFHGLLLFLCIDIIVDNRIVLANNSNMFWTLVSVVAVILVVSSWLAHVLIERPVMRKVDFVKRCLLTLPW